MAAAEQKSGAGAGQDGDLDSYLEYGRYQALQVWVFGAVLGACEYRAFHLPSVAFSNFDIYYINIHNIFREGHLPCMQRSSTRNEHFTQQFFVNQIEL